jgi:hypothetical protein
VIPKSVLGAAWKPQKERVDAAIYFPLFLVLVSKAPKGCAIYYLSADLQDAKLFKKRTPLSPDARRAGWQGFMYETKRVTDSFVRLV